MRGERGAGPKFSCAYVGKKTGLRRRVTQSLVQSGNFAMCLSKSRRVAGGLAVRCKPKMSGTDGASSDGRGPGGDGRDALIAPESQYLGSRESNTYMKCVPPQTEDEQANARNIHSHGLSPCEPCTRPTQGRRNEMYPPRRSTGPKRPWSQSMRGSSG